MSLEELRKRIDELDHQLVQLLNERARVVVEIGKLKNKVGKAVYSPDREKEVFARIADANMGPLPDKCLVAIWRELMSGSFVLERPLRIGYLGPGGSFSHTAAMLKFGQSVEYEPLADITSIFDEVSKGHCDLGLAPIENTTGGGVIETLDALIDSNVKVCAEVLMAVHHNLLGNCSLDKIEKIYSKPEVFAQCRNWLSATFKNAQTVPVASTAKAAQMAAEESGAAAIGSKVAAELYGLRIVCENIEDIANNVTRFLVIGREDARPTGEDKTAILFSTAHKAGALADVLEVFKRFNINLTNIESRPSKKRQWEYYFFMDFVGHRTDEQVKKALEETRKHCLQLSTLGSFPRATELL
ncbi:MAG: prephenate dehydratase [Phycisphaerae bacterium]|nr:prephenate dehydratase [Phycisphaerae bacterium]NIP51652.1 prephenate dehydratase [Phycisphaerae bacterium]NIS50762.1 prephenate dehydratase [Phycisphaerae bacterium]NIU08513.1 prephenate dehydratase [Phycisphaerae bacterium]NIU57795.1 prephenate dehydratase [Phycisphaerae bacterium]